MKKKILISMLILTLASMSGITMAKTTTNSDLAEAIKMYKAGNYTGCYERLDYAIKKDPSNPVCYYYKAISAAQVGKKSEAIENYEKTLSLAPKKSSLAVYSARGKACIENPESCQIGSSDSKLDSFIRGKSASGFSDEAREMFERLKIEQMMRDMNRQDDINPQRFKEYKDFSSANTPSEIPNNDEIVAAVRTLQNAGLLNFGNGSSTADLSLITGSNNSVNGMMNFANMNPQLLHTMLTSGMSMGF